MEWHSTHSREELIVALRGQVRVDIQQTRGQRSLALQAGECLFLPQETQHRVLNLMKRQAKYLYVTAVVSSQR